MNEIDPHEDLISYYDITRTFRSTFDVNHFFNSGEHYNITSDIERNIFLLKRLSEAGLLMEESRVCDCGLGLGNALFDLYLQSKEVDGHAFTFTGIEKHAEYVDFLRERLMHLWNTGLILIHGDIMDQDYSNYEIVYSYSPFNNRRQLDLFYNKIADEARPGTIIIEHANGGLGNLGSLESVLGLERRVIGGQTLFVKG